jgi:hypothetical protein
LPFSALATSFPITIQTRSTQHMLSFIE